MVSVLLFCVAGCTPPAQGDLANFFVDFARELTAAWLF
jgi:hypothetical protein